MNIKGKDGPVLKSYFTCENCKFLSEFSLTYGKYPYKCQHEDVLNYNKSNFQVIYGDIGTEKITPIFCPFLLRKQRFEKLNKIDFNKTY